MLQNIKPYIYIVMLTLPSIGVAAPECEKWIAKMVSTKGRVEKQRLDQDDWRQVEKNEYFCQGDRIRTQKHSRVTLELGNESLVTLEQRSTLTFPIIDKGSFSWLLELFQGSAFFRSRSPHQLKIDTPYVNAVHEGTEFMVAVTDQQTEISVFDGRVSAENKAGKVQIDKGQIGIATKDQITRVQALTIHPKDAVQWALYYPPIVDYQSLGSIPTIPAIQQSLNYYQQGDVHRAISILDNIPEQQQDQHYFALKASLLLTVGSVDEALQEIDRAQHIKASGSAALAIKSVIAVTKNHADEALKLAQKATELNPSSAVAKIALSYAYQAAFKIPEALEATEQAVKLAPNNALAWARLSELQLSSGERSDALESAQKAQLLNPQLDRTQTILGFANLAQIDIDEAKTAFTQAIDLNSADPLARLGLGLAKIRKGAIEEGARDLETAVSLDPDNAIMRSYLGKAYYELKNDGYAGTELAIAKEMDPNDPTPWFYDAIRKQTTNRPVEALHDMQKAIELNDNRGVYRSKLLLDEDLAARSASLGRIYNDLGFEQLGLVEGWKSVNTDPSNHSAHRLLADNYAALPRHEIARVSELLQAQLLQPINITPVQPSLGESNLLILEGSGPSISSFNEFNPLFTSNRLSLQASGVVGNNDTLGDEVTQSGVWNNFSYSLGQFHFETDGIGVNNDLRHDIYNVFSQWLVTPKTSIQGELRRRETKTGKVALTFDPLDTDFRQEFEQYLARFGLHIKPTLNQDTLLSFAYQSNEIATSDLTPLGPDFFGRERTIDKTDTYHFELQHQYKSQSFNTIAGLGYVHGPFSRKVMRDAIFEGQVVVNPNRPLVRVDDTVDASHFNAYVYVPYKLTPNMLVTLGLSYDDTKDVGINESQINPKFGLVWNVTNDTTLRAAAFRVKKRPFPSNQTIEPTQLAGFNQFFDDSDGTDSIRYGIGLDHRLTTNLFTGLELSQRQAEFKRIIVPDLTMPRRLSEFDVINHEQHEDFHRAYAYWTPMRYLAIGVEYQYERFDREQIGIDVGDPQELITHYVPLSMKYFHPSGFFATFEATHVNQSLNYVTFDEEGKIGEREGGDDFWVLDMSVGYRFPKRYGLLKLEIQNLTDEEFRFQSFFNPEEQRTPRFQPGIAINTTLTLWF